MKTMNDLAITYDEICDSQLFDFEHSQKFVIYEDYLESIALAKGQFDIVKMERDRLKDELMWSEKCYAELVEANKRLAAR